MSHGLGTGSQPQNLLQMELVRQGRALPTVQGWKALNQQVGIPCAQTHIAAPLSNLVCVNPGFNFKK